PAVGIPGAAAPERGRAARCRRAGDPARRRRGDLPAVPLRARRPAPAGSAVSCDAVGGPRRSARARHDQGRVGGGRRRARPALPPPLGSGAQGQVVVSRELALSIAPMTLDDLDDVLAIERASFQTPWSRGAFRYELTQNRVARSLVVRAGQQLVGY